ncbi:MAG: hypothetical protein ING44_13740 [Telmatospirillum sp.]|nr:hypothetical protein [Telmatospirillum sp.]
MRVDHRALNGFCTGPRLGSGGGRAIVVFRDATEIRWLRFLKRGFRHCAVLVEVECGWILCDALSHRTLLKCIFDASSREIVERLGAAGLHAIEVRVQMPRARIAPILPFTCVEVVKRVLGIHAWGIFTPWQLYRHLIRDQKFIIDN